jgi:aspartate--ammonia ligase
MKEDILKTEAAIRLVKETFSQRIMQNLKLVRVSAPLVVLDGTGINDDLNGIERPVSFQVKSLGQQQAVVVHSLAKWKRMRLKQMDIPPGCGILTEMLALRPDEDYSSLHSIYVDQWDWEQHIRSDNRTLNHLKKTVSSIYQSLKETEQIVNQHYPAIPAVLPDEIRFIHAEELLQEHPGLNPSQRETVTAKKYGAVFIMGIGARLSDGQAHDGRAPDYDDWSSVNEDGHRGLNGDIIVWHPVLKQAVELSSMGIRVNPAAMMHQLTERKCLDRTNLMFHQQLLSGTLPPSIGGGIGQSRVCLFMLRKQHIGQVQVSIWPDTERQKLLEEGIVLL